MRLAVQFAKLQLFSGHCLLEFVNGESAEIDYPTLKWTDEKEKGNGYDLNNYLNEHGRKKRKPKEKRIARKIKIISGTAQVQLNTIRIKNLHFRFPKSPKR